MAIKEIKAYRAGIFCPIKMTEKVTKAELVRRIEAKRNLEPGTLEDLMKCTKKTLERLSE